VPRRNDDHGAAPRQRRARKAKPARTERERGLMMRLLLHSPRDTVAGAVAFAAVLAVIVNAMFLQHGRHPAPMFGGQVMLLKPAAESSPATTSAVAPAATTPPSMGAPAGPLPRPRPAGADRRGAAMPDAAPPQATGARGADPIGHLVRKVAVRSETPREPSRDAAGDSAPTPAASRRVAAVQRLLSDYGFGQLAPSGQLDADTRAAIRKFELTRRLPVSGQVSDRVVAELAAMTGQHID
jgi:hypothetical protein